jgi:hypothetical protein
LDADVRDTPADINNEPSADLPPDEPDGGDADAGPQWPPAALDVAWVNIQAGDRVTFRKQIVVEVTAPSGPRSWADQRAWSAAFPASVQTEGGTHLPLRQRWVDETLRFRPAVIIEPLPQGWPQGERLLLNLRTGPETSIEVPFTTLPQDSPDLREVDLLIPARDCPDCFPWPVRVTVFLPPGYIDDEVGNPAPSPSDPAGGSPAQRYPVSVLLHDAGSQQGYLNVARAAGPLMTIGAMEPTIIVLPDGRVAPDVCAQEPQLSRQGCHTRFLGTWRSDSTISSYTTFLADDLREALRTQFRIRGAQDATIVDAEIYRRSHALSGVSAGGYGALINAFTRPDAWYASVAVIAGVVSAFNPYAVFGGEIRPRGQICPTPTGRNYPRVRSGRGFRDLTGVDPATNRRRAVSFEDRRVPQGAANCFQSVPAVPHELVRSGFCRLDATCLVAPDAPSSLNAVQLVRDEYPMHGNLYFDTGIFDGGGPPSAFMDLDAMLDLARIPHSFRFEDRGALQHGSHAVQDRYYGAQWITNRVSGPCKIPLLPGNHPGTGAVYSFHSRAMEGVGNRPFNSFKSSEFTVGAMDADRDGVLDFADPAFPDLAESNDNCPAIFNPDQTDKDNDRIGDACDDDIDGDGIPNEEDSCNRPDDRCEEDQDGDMIPDSHDICPAEFDPLQLDWDEDGLGNACDEDDDGDGHNDLLDNCPAIPNPDQFDPNNDGVGALCAPAWMLEHLLELDRDGDGTGCTEDCDDLDPDRAAFCD